MSDEFALARIVSVARLLADTPPELHPRIVRAASSRLLHFHLAERPAPLSSVCDDFSDTGAEISFEGPGKMPYRCRSLSIKRALRNLIENAVRYGERARVTLSEDAGMLRIRSADDGPGIDEADRERVFEPFVRLEASRNLETGGVGLGLAIARSIVRRHGGDIVLENHRPSGLLVTLILPTERRR